MNAPLNTSSTPSRLALTVGPVLYHWSRDTLMHFYASLADGPADTIVLGEAVCARRRELRLDDWLALGRDLTDAGKEVVLVAQTLIETEADLRLLERQAEQQSFAVEAGDASALQLLAGRVPLVLGPHLNIYSREALVEHADLGAQRWVAPVELALDKVALVNPSQDPVRTPTGEVIATEAWVFGRLPLAFSARCFTARHHHVLNGTQTQSAAVQNLLGDGPALRAAGVTRLRLSPCAQGFTEVLNDFDAVMNLGKAVDGRVAAWVDSGMPGPFSNGYARGLPGMTWSDA
jgi:collagenase-like PrtC family protease